MQARVAKVESVVIPSANTPLGHLKFLHGGDDSTRSYATIAQKLGSDSRKPFDQQSGPFEDLAEIVPAYGGLDDVYVSQNRFFGSRKLSRLAELSSLYSDIDFFKVGDLAEMSPMGVFKYYALDALEEARIPPPSLAISTGRGLALVWRHTPVPRAVLKKWNLCQEHIFRALEDLGADSKAKDAARVMRLIGTRNSKSGAPVEAIWEDIEREVWDFGDLSDEILPITRRELEERRARRREEGARKKGSQKDVEKPSKRRTRPAEGKSPRTLNEARLSDLNHLMELRGQSTLPEGERNGWMFVAAVAMSCLWEPRFFEREIVALGREKAGWDEDETRSRMHTVIENTRKAGAGGTVEWSGQQRDPRYRLTNARIIRDLAITSEEQTHLKIIISKEIKGQRDKDRKERERRSQGAAPRDEYIAEARERRQHQRQKAKELSSQGLSLRKIGDKIGVSHSQVRRLLDAKPE